jgi:hypothetical protein
MLPEEQQVKCAVLWDEINAITVDVRCKIRGSRTPIHDLAKMEVDPTAVT